VTFSYEVGLVYIGRLYKNEGNNMNMFNLAIMEIYLPLAPVTNLVGWRKTKPSIVLHAPLVLRNGICYVLPATTRLIFERMDHQAGFLSGPFQANFLFVIRPSEKQDISAGAGATHARILKSLSSFPLTLAQCILRSGDEGVRGRQGRRIQHPRS
jgi:hypothetical protein